VFGLHGKHPPFVVFNKPAGQKLVSHFSVAQLALVKAGHTKQSPFFLMIAPGVQVGARQLLLVASAFK